MKIRSPSPRPSERHLVTKNSRDSGDKVGGGYLGCWLANGYTSQKNRYDIIKFPKSDHLIFRQVFIEMDQDKIVPTEVYLLLSTSTHSQNKQRQVLYVIQLYWLFSSQAKHKQNSTKSQLGDKPKLSLLPNPGHYSSLKKRLLLLRRSAAKNGNVCRPI